MRERERGNLELLITTPVRPMELIVGKVLPFVGIGLIQVSIVLTLGVLIFHLPIRGHLIEVYAAALTYIVAALALGVFISTLAKTQFQAMQVAFFTFLPQILLSGFMFPYAGMPKAAQYFAEILPLTHFIRLIRGIVLRGASLPELRADLLALPEHQRKFIRYFSETTRLTQLVADADQSVAQQHIVGQIDVDFAGLVLDGDRHPRVGRHAALPQFANEQLSLLVLLRFLRFVLKPHIGVVQIAPQELGHIARQARFQQRLVAKPPRSRIPQHQIIAIARHKAHQLLELRREQIHFQSLILHNALQAIRGHGAAPHT